MSLRLIAMVLGYVAISVSVFKFWPQTDQDVVLATLQAAPEVVASATQPVQPVQTTANVQTTQTTTTEVATTTTEVSQTPEVQETTSTEEEDAMERAKNLELVDY